MNESYFQSIAQATKERGEVTWKTPSNIALVKYWGKKENQIPSQPFYKFYIRYVFYNYSARVFKT